MISLFHYRRQFYIFAILVGFILFFSVDVSAQETSKNSWENFEELSKAVSSIDRTYQLLKQAVDELKKKVAAENIPSGITASVDLLETNLSALKTSLSSYDKSQHSEYADKEGRIKKQIAALEESLKECQDATESKEEAVKVIVAKLETLDKLINEMNLTNALGTENQLLKEDKKRLSEDVKKFEERIGQLPSKADIGNVFSEELKKSLEKKNWGFGIGFFLNYPEKAEDKEYFVNADTFLVANDKSRTVGLNLAGLIYYKLSHKFSLQTSIPILRFIDPTGAPTSFFQRVSGTIGIGYRNKENQDYWITLMANFGEIKVLQSGAENLYVGRGDDKKVRKFPGPSGATIDPDSEAFKSFFDTDVQVSISLGISIKI